MLGVWVYCVVRHFLCKWVWAYFLCVPQPNVTPFVNKRKTRRLLRQHVRLKFYLIFLYVELSLPIEATHKLIHKHITSLAQRDLQQSRKSNTREPMKRWNLWYFYLIEQQIIQKFRLRFLYESSQKNSNQQQLKKKTDEKRVAMNVISIFYEQ